MKPPYKKIAALIPLALITTACTQSMSPHRYDSHAVGEARRVERGVVDSYRWVEINSQSGVGTAVGVGVGAAAGSTIGNGGAENVIGAIGGALLGGLLGNSIDKSAGRKSGFEYMIRTESGSLISIVQQDRHPFAEGTPVMVVFSRDRSRVILDHSAYEDNRGNGPTRYEPVPAMEPFGEEDVIEPSSSDTQPTYN